VRREKLRFLFNKKRTPTPIIYNLEEPHHNETAENKSFKFPESSLMHKWLDGWKGLEIGASSHNAFGLDTVNVDYTSEETVFSKEQEQNAGVYRRVDIVSPANRLPYGDNEVDFIISSHVIEHFYDPIDTICEWLRVVKNGGIVATIAPHKMRTGDKDRGRTTLNELIQRRKVPDPKGDPSQHWVIWITEDFLAMCKYMDWKVVEYQDTDDKVGNGFAVIVVKTETSLSKC